jgi:alkylated DNA repair dioxygenase AlkB
MLDLEPDRLIDLPDATLRYLPHLLRHSAQRLLAVLIEETAWRQDEITLWGRRHLQPRLSAWHGDPQARYTYSGLNLTPQPWTQSLLEIKAAVETVADHSFNSVLLNYYRNQHDSMGFHSDDEAVLGPRPVIGSVSLGCVRTFILKPRRRCDQKPVRLALESGSLLLMSGYTQHHWKHGINKEKAVLGARVNLTFRSILAGS